MKNPSLAILILLITLVTLGGAIHPALAQTPFGTILGTVTDSTGAVVPGVAITVTHVSSKIKYETVTDSLGNYAVHSLPPGRYEVAAQHSGFRAEIVKDLVLEVEKKARVDFTLSVGSVAEKVEVIATIPLVDTDSSTVGTVVENRKIVDLPLNGRNFLQLATLTPSVLQPPAGVGVVSAGVLPGVMIGSTNSIGGARIGANGLLLDGVDFTTPNTNGANVQPPPDAIQEFKIQTTTMNPEFARPAVMNLISRSGTNGFHGNAYEFFRNNVLDAKDFFTNRAGTAKPPLRFNQFGATAGGPIIVPGLYDGRNRTFIFGNYEGFRIRGGKTILANLPSPALLGGDFSALATAINDPSTGRPFAGNRIPQQRISRFATKFTPFIPAPNLPPGQIPGVNLALPASDPSRLNIFSIRVDQKIAKGFLWGRYHFQDGGARVVGLTDLWDILNQTRAQNLILGANHTFSSTLINEFRAAYNRLRIFSGSTPATGDTNYGGDVLGLKNLSVAKGLFTFPGVSVSGFSALGNPRNGSTLTQNVNTYDYVDNLTAIRGRHTLKVGLNVRRVQFTLGDGQLQNGLLIFTGSFTGNAVGDYLLGNPLQAVVGIGQNGELGLSTQYGAFVQDDWKVKPRLTLNYGLRYEYFSPPVTPNDRQAILDPSFPGGRILIANSPNYVIPATGIVRGSGGPLVSRGMIDPDYNNLAPRFGFAFRPFNDNKTAIRGGYGVFFDRPIENEQSLSRTLPPFFFQQTVVSSSVTPQLSTDDLFPVPTAFPGGGSGSRSRTERTPYLQQWSLNVQRELGPNWLIELGYLGAKGTKLQIRRPFNQAVTGSGALTDRVPLRNFTPAFVLSDHLASSVYHALTAKVEKRFSNGLSFLGSYTFGKIIDTVSGSVPNFGSSITAQNNNCLSCERGRSDVDARHRLVVSYTYELPFGRGKRLLSTIPGALDLILGGWQIAGITTFQSGSPANATVPGDNANVGAGAQRPDRTGSVSKMDFRKTGFAFDTSPFARPAPGRFGNAGRNIVPGPGVNNFDFGFYKNIFFDQEHKRSVQFRLEMFNIFNHAQFTPPGAAFGTPQFGRFLGTRPPRQMQMALKLNY